jgi:general secretion pathway protein K
MCLFPKRKGRGVVRLRAFALISVLILVSILSLVALEFSQRSALHLRMTNNYSQAKKALYYAYGGYQAALSLLMNDTNGYDGPGDMWYGPLTPVPFGTGSIAVRIDDEQSRFNVRKLVTEFGFEDKRRSAMLSRLFEKLAVEPSLIGGLVDWQDSDDLPVPDGAEASYYNSLSPPYAPTNRPLLSIGEILNVRGFERDLFFLSPASRSPLASEELAPLSDYLTPYGDGKININTAELPVLISLSADMDEFIAREVIAKRVEGPFERIEDLKQVETVSNVLYDEISSLITVKSDAFRITSTGYAAGFTEVVTAVVVRRGAGVRVVYFNRSL